MRYVEDDDQEKLKVFRTFRDQIRQQITKYLTEQEYFKDWG